MSHQLKKLLPRHRRILELCLEGRTFTAIAKEVMMSPKAVAYIYKSPIFVEEFDRRWWKNVLGEGTGKVSDYMRFSGQKRHA